MSNQELATTTPVPQAASPGADIVKTDELTEQLYYGEDPVVPTAGDAEGFAAFCKAVKELNKSTWAFLTLYFISGPAVLFFKRYPIKELSREWLTSGCVIVAFISGCCAVVSAIKRDSWKAQNILSALFMFFKFLIIVDSIFSK